MEEHWVKTLANSMAAKIIAFTILGLLSVAVSIGLFTNKHVKIFGVEFNDGKDTFTKVVYIDTGKTKVIYEPEKKEKDYVNINKQKPTTTPINIKKDTSNSATFKTGNIQGQGIQLGNNNTQNNDFTVKQRHIDQQELIKIISKIPNQNTLIHFWIPSSVGGKESINYANEILIALYNTGYKNIDRSWSNWMDPYDFDKLEYGMKDSVFEIKVFPANNVRN